MPPPRAAQANEQLLDIARVLGKELAVAVHELAELLFGVLAAGVGVEQVVEIVQHLVHAGPVLVGRVLERLLHSREALVEHLAAQQVPDLLVVLPGFRLRQS